MIGVKFTKGPWRVVDDGVRHVCSGQFKVCTVQPYDLHGMVVTESANADLIAAAPTLYEALERLCSEVNGIDLCSAPSYAVEALKKARGE